ncbi:ankyrin repeat-containing protein BDA1-like [Gossypium arboreum]|uniref:ankyrin repeat-containing protein BDA1-like n=1 Tax=Gossypium arboreum TaxID=29729 RepID=UPI0022F1C143|nr:ankyrin repeat-containing protein BDA1-like [Gossypium arboreum]
MDESLRTAARTGNVSDLYSLIQRNGNVLRSFDEVEFMETPLHVAAEEGCIGFAMEMMNLKPSFARKLNQQGLSPIHIAVKKGHKEMVLRFLEIDKDLVRVKGKKGKTPLHLISKVGNPDGLVDRFLKVCPQSIKNVTTRNRTALHIAAEKNRLDAFQVLIRTLKKKDYCQEVVNRKDEDGNTALHISAINNQPQLLKLLLECKADKHETNEAGFTALKALKVADQQNNIESISILRDCCPGVSNFKYKLKKQIGKYVAKASLLIFDDVDNISSEDRSILLIILGVLLLKASFQVNLSPPGGVLQGENFSKSKGSYDANAPGKSVLGEVYFLRFFVPTYVVFMTAWYGGVREVEEKHAVADGMGVTKDGASVRGKWGVVAKGRGACGVSRGQVGGLVD